MVLDGENEIKIERIKEAAKEVKKEGVLIEIRQKGGGKDFYLLWSIKGNRILISHALEEKRIWIEEGDLKNQVQGVRFFTAEETLEMILSLQKQIQGLKKNITAARNYLNGVGL